MFSANRRRLAGVLTVALMAFSPVDGIAINAGLVIEAVKGVFGPND
ncbi:secreted protein [Rhodopirellula baltica WH47]|uniref:Secreted protein n=1 Tax=Rhodopirellula baltica WH47 TaxID=991778 RepID=F2AQ76_RHOBT|nr:secreted protein [Rhodopirellula baltica WH47]